MDDFLDCSRFDKWRELLEKNNYSKSRRPYKILGIAILYHAKLREWRAIPFMQLQSELDNLSKYSDSLK